MLIHFGMFDANPVSISADPHAKLWSNDVENIACQKIPYRKAVGALLFLASVSRSDLFYVEIVNRYLNNNCELSGYSNRAGCYLRNFIKYNNNLLMLQ